jgi:hypothetical protein
MTSQSPRIYIYKITFEEVPYYYYGVHKEKVFDEEYWGTPITHKWCWDFYIPKKQILQFFDFTDEGWLEANNIERRIIKPVLSDKYCLNEGCGGVFSFKALSKGGKISGKNNYKNKIGIHKQTKEEKDNARKKGHKIQKELGVGFWGLTLEQRQKNAKKGDIKRKENKSGLYGLSTKERSEAGKKSAQQLHSQRWMCTETGHITNAGALTRYQKHRKIDTSKRVRIS